MLIDITKTVDGDTKKFILNDIYSYKVHCEIDFYGYGEGFLVKLFDGCIYFVTDKEAREYYKFDTSVDSLEIAKKIVEFCNKSYEKGKRDFKVS